MKVLKRLFILLVALTSLAFGLLLLLQESKDSQYIDIYGKDDAMY